MNPLIKKKLSILIHLADIDGEFAKVEKSYIEEVAEKNGVTKLELADLINSPDPIGGLGALSYQKAIEYMCDSLSLMAVDHKIQPSEVLLCEDIGLRLGFKKHGIDKIIDHIKENPTISYKKLESELRTLPHTGK